MSTLYLRSARERRCGAVMAESPGRGQTGPAASAWLGKRDIAGANLKWALWPHKNWEGLAWLGPVWSVE